MDNIQLFSIRLNEMLDNRKPKKIKKIELADKIYVTPQTVSRWCNGVIMPDRSTIELITRAINELYGYSPTSSQRYRSEYLACEDKIPTYNFLSKKVMDFLTQQKKEQLFMEQILSHIESYMIDLGYEPADIHDVTHFSSFVCSYIKIAIESYMENINPNRKDGE